MTLPAMVAEFRGALAQGKLLIQKCNDCGRPNMYPRYACPYCQSQSLGWQQASGKGTLVSYTVLRMGAPEGFESELPYGLGIVRLEEDVQILSRLIPDADGDWHGYGCDKPVTFVPMPREQMERRPCAWFKRA
jgi:hypothetical protein